jgi:ParB family transcriptional regulator, chromosome partitioning protein
MSAVTGVAEVRTESIAPNPHNPRLFFNEESLDFLRTSIQEIGILVPLIVYRDSNSTHNYVLLDGERRLRCALDLGLETVPVNVIPEPSAMDNVLRMFNIHSVREEWPLVSVALSLKSVMEISNETRESRLAEMTGLTRSAVRRAKRLLTLPEQEINLIRKEAHFPRSEQVHREDLYLEIEAAESTLRNAFPEIEARYSRETIIRQFALKRELGHLNAITDFRMVSRLIEAARTELVPRHEIIQAIELLIEDASVNPVEIFDSLLASSYQQRDVFKKSSVLLADLDELSTANRLSEELVETLLNLREKIDGLLKRHL